MSDLQTNLEQILNEKETKIIPENIKKGVQIFDIVGTLEQGTSGVKLFETQEEMQADTTAKEGDLAVVYRSEIQNMTADTQTQYITFPETVTLQEAFAGNASTGLRAVDSSVMFSGNATVQSDVFNFDVFSEKGMIRVMYTSSDGITYTRTEFSGGSGALTNPVDLGTIIKVGNSEAWNDVLGHFMQVEGNIFEGLFVYNESLYILAPTQLNAISSTIYNAVAYGKDGVAEGTLTQSPSNSFADINAEVYYKIQKAYDSMEPIVLTDKDKEIDKNIYFIPTKTNGIPLLDTSNLTNINNLFSFCRKLSFIPLLDISNAISAYQAFSYCSGLISIPLFNTGKITNMQNMFYGCTNLTSIPQLNTSKSTNMQEIFAHCTSLVEVPVLDTGKVTNMMDMFFYCTSLSDDSLNNILQMCVNASSYTKTKTLKYIGLTQEQATKCTTLSNYEAFTAAGWTTGY